MEPASPPPVPTPGMKRGTKRCPKPILEATDGMWCRRVTPPTAAAMSR